MDSEVEESKDDVADECRYGCEGAQECGLGSMEDSQRADLVEDHAGRVAPEELRDIHDGVGEREVRTEVVVHDDRGECAKTRDGDGAKRDKPDGPQTVEAWKRVRAIERQVFDENLAKYDKNIDKILRIPEKG